MSYRNGRGRGRRHNNYSESRHRSSSRRRGRDHFSDNLRFRKKSRPPTPEVREHNNRDEEEEEQEPFGTIRVIEDEEEEEEEERTETLYRALCAENPTHVLSSSGERSKDDTIRRWGTENLVKTDDAQSTMWFKRECCRECHAIVYNGRSIISELKRIYRPGETAVTVRDVYYDYDNTGHKGDFQGKVTRMDLSRVEVDGGDTKVTVVVWIEIFRKGHGSNSRSFRISGMHKREENPERTVEWKDRHMYAVMHDEYTVTVNPRCITSRIQSVFPGIKCKQWCKKDSRGACETHNLRHPTRL
jgi:hypothetical protein